MSASHLRGLIVALRNEKGSYNYRMARMVWMKDCSTAK